MPRWLSGQQSIAFPPHATLGGLTPNLDGRAVGSAARYSSFVQVLFDPFGAGAGTTCEPALRHRS